MRIRVAWTVGSIEGELRDTPTAARLMEVLPFSARANTWGEEVYFDAPMTAELEPDCTPVVDPGTICFWAQGAALALPYGPTPVSEGDECRLVTAVNIVGMFDGDPKLLATIRPGEKVTVEAC
jgi:hypothetical protein